MKITSAIVLLISFLFLVRCKHEIPIPNGGNNVSPGISNACSSDSIYFVNSILPVINSNCAMSGCHDVATHKEGLVLSDYNGILKIIKPGNPTDSKLFQVITSGNHEDIMPPPPQTPLSATTIAAIRKWINQGAKNNQCVSDCDTSVFSFSGTVFPLMNTYCKGCHNPASLGGGIDLSSYAGVRVIALNGKLSGSVNHKAGYVPMPQGRKLQECQIRQIEKWINSGALNN